MEIEQSSQTQRKRLALGLTLAVLAGVVFGHAITSRQTLGWVTGLITLLCGALLILSTVYVRRGRPRSMAQPLGHILVTRGWITDSQLSEALARHHREGRPIGQILVDMRVITPVQLSRALGDQGPGALDSPVGQVQTIIADANPGSKD